MGGRFSGRKDLQREVKAIYWSINPTILEERSDFSPLFRYLSSLVGGVHYHAVEATSGASPRDIRAGPSVVNKPNTILGSKLEQIS